MELNDEQIERAKKSYLYKKEYYSKYQKENKKEVNKRQLKYLKKVYENPEKLNQMKEKQKEYYRNTIKPKRDAIKEQKRLNKIRFVKASKEGNGDTPHNQI